MNWLRLSAADADGADVEHYHTRVADLVMLDHLIADPPVPVHGYRDEFGNWHTNISKISGAISRRDDVHAAIEGNREMAKVPADAGTIAVSLPCGPACPRVLVTEDNVLENEIADSLDPAPPKRCLPNSDPAISDREW